MLPLKVTTLLNVGYADIIDHEIAFHIRFSPRITFFIKEMMITGISIFGGIWFNILLIHIKSVIALHLS